MARFYDSIGKTVRDFFKTDTYNLNRKVVLRVRDDPVNWELENTFDDDGALQSTLSVGHRIAKEELRLKASTTKNPEFSVSSKRVSNVEGKLCLQDPNVKMELKYKHNDQAGVKFEAKHDWSKFSSELKLNGAYNGIDQFVFGIDGKIPIKNDYTVNKDDIDYNVGVEYNRNNKNNQLFITTENKLSTISFGGFIRIRDINNGYFRFQYHNRNRNNNNNNNNNNLTFDLGYSRLLTNNSTLGFLYRSNVTGSLFYNTALNDNKLRANVAFNYDFAKNVDNRYSLQYKLVFGQI